MNSMKLSLVALGAAMALLTSTGAARADETPPPQTSPDQSAGTPEAKPFKSWSLELNPLAATIGRYSIQAEWLPMEHHAIVLNPHFDHTSSTVGGSDGLPSYTESFTGFGGELGYRFYTGSRGANGFFVGPSFLLANYSPSVGGQSGPSFTSVGGAVDIGGQFIVGPGIVIGGGFGLQYTAVSGGGNTDGMPLLTQALVGDGLRPRFLLSAGYAF
jgi:hypothetical protein